MNAAQTSVFTLNYCVFFNCVLQLFCHYSLQTISLFDEFSPLLNHRVFAVFVRARKTSVCTMNCLICPSTCVKFIGFYNESWMLLNHQSYAGSVRGRKTHVFSLVSMLLLKISITFFWKSVKPIAIYNELSSLLNRRVFAVSVRARETSVFTMSYFKSI